MLKKPEPLRFTMDMILLSVPAVLLAQGINELVTTIWMRLLLNIAVSLTIVYTFPDMITRHVLERTFPGVLGMTVFLSVQRW